MKVEFNDDQLIAYSDALDHNAFAPTSLFKHHFSLPQNYAVPVEDVEDFMYAFYTTYNHTFGVKY